MKKEELVGTNGIECVACKKLHTRLGYKFCDYCSDNLTLKEKILAMPIQPHHTPTPWKIDPLGLGTPWNIGTEAHNVILVAETSDDCRNANAAFIVRAVNSHEELLTAFIRLRNEAGHFIATGKGKEFLANAYKLATEAIAKAEGK